VRAFGTYWFVFNQALSAADSGDVVLSFTGRVRSSGETLYVDRQDEFIPYDRPDTVFINALSDSRGRQENLEIRISFRTARGEQEDNSELQLSDTLRLGDLRDGVTGIGGSSPVDRDYFTAAPARADSFRITVSLLSSIPVFCVRLPDNTCWDLRLQKSVSFKANDTVSFFISNEYGQERYNSQGWYRVRMDPVR
jgi:hypothetical protein